ncbi:hypothetical protein CTEN210_16060 [Chaetoceros tenuissimus]|uniref:Uncharacterized protein n=1 Tax=Chaetoceros tenuissimus TaxID=426638 RepID=A0AAD3HDW3_9STRA|nr:hypothetical protein CTEN210_16060 [Chaetoceros tenuissimus]
MGRQHDIRFTGNFKQNVPTNILAAVPDEYDVLFKTAPFEHNLPLGMDVNEAMNLDDKNLEEKAALCFPIGSVWQRKEFERKLTHFCTASDFNFSWTCDSNTSFQCSKYGNPRPKKGEKISAKEKNTMKCGCTWRIITSNLWTFPPKKEGGQQQKWFTTPPDEETKNSMFIVVKELPKQPHNHPGDKTTYQDTLKKGGHVSRAIGEDSAMVRNCLLILRNRGGLSNRDIQTLGRVSTPSCVVWDNDRCSNWRKKMVRLSMSLKPEQYETQKAFEASFMSSEIQKMFKDDIGDAEFTDIVNKRAKEELSKFYNERFQRLDPETQESEIDAWFNRMKEMDPFFDYELMLNDQKEIIGVAWMTGQMRCDLEDLGDYLMLDMMKKETNTSLFLYASIVLHRADQSLCVACEALLLNESLPTYKFLCDATFNMAFEIKKEDVDIIAGDEFLDQDKIRDVLGFPNAKFIFDQFHLIQVNLRKKFAGTMLFELLESQIYKWINATTEPDFIDQFGNLKKQMENHGCTASQINAIKDLNLKKDHFAWYKLRSYKGTLRRKGNSGSESNHASVVRCLNSNALLEIPVMFSTLSNRQLHFNFRSKQNYESSKRLLDFENNQTQIPILMNASECIDGRTLNYHGYKLLEDQYNLSNHLSYKEDEDGNLIFDDGIILEKNKPCKCEYRMADKIQCCHEIKRSGVFDLQCFARRYIYHNRPWERSIPRNGVDKESLGNCDFNPSNAPSNKTAGLSTEERSDSDNLVYEEESSVLLTKFSYHEMMDLTKNLVTALTNRPREFKKRVCATIFAMTQLAKSDTMNTNSELDSLWNSYLHTEQEHLRSSKTTDPPKKSRSFSVTKKRIKFGTEYTNGSTGLGKGRRRSLNSREEPKDAQQVKKSKKDCSFCNNPTCTSKTTKNCPILLKHGGTVIARYSNYEKNQPNQNLLDSLLRCKICMPTDNEYTLKGTFDGNSQKHTRHFILHSVHWRKRLCTEHANDPNNVDVLVTAIDFQGNINDDCRKRLAPYIEFQRFVLLRAEKNRFIIDRREFDQVNDHDRSRMVPAIEKNVMVPTLSRGNQAPNARIDERNTNESSQIVATTTNNGAMPFPSQDNQALSAGNMQALATTMHDMQFPMPGLSQGVPLSQPNGLSQGVPLSQPNGLSQGVPLSQPNGLSQGVPIFQPNGLSQGVPIFQLNGQVSMHGHQHFTAQGYQFPCWPQGYASGNGSFNGRGSYSYDCNHQSQNDPKEKEFDM